MTQPHDHPHTGENHLYVKEHAMRIRDFMSTPTMTISPTASVIEARDLMRQRQVRHLPVLNSERVVGIVTDRDIRTVLP